jgi:hypothetical protein
MSGPPAARRRPSRSEAAPAWPRTGLHDVIRRPWSSIPFIGPAAGQPSRKAVGGRLIPSWREVPIDAHRYGGRRPAADGRRPLPGRTRRRTSTWRASGGGRAPERLLPHAPSIEGERTPRRPLPESTPLSRPELTAWRTRTRRVEGIRRWRGLAPRRAGEQDRAFRQVEVAPAQRHELASSSGRDCCKPELAGVVRVGRVEERAEHLVGRGLASGLGRLGPLDAVGRVGLDEVPAHRLTEGRVQQVVHPPNR